MQQLILSTGCKLYGHITSGAYDGTSIKRPSKPRIKFKVVWIRVQ